MVPVRCWFAVLATSLTIAAAYDTKSEPQDGKINVHLVPHTHDDAGWKRTVDEYYSGLNASIQDVPAVSQILDAVVRALAENSDRTFSYVEQAFFQRWWRQQNEHIKQLTRQLIAKGQLSMINGGWVMHCEGTTHYLDMIDQTTLGHKFLMEEFGVMPRIGWQLDPFGHSATQAALLSEEVGFTGLFFGRIDYQDRLRRIDTKEAEFIWRASKSLGKNAQVFAGLTGSYNGNYGPPAGFCFDINQHCKDEPIQDDPDLDNYNVKNRVDEFVAAAMWQASHTRGSHILMTLGGDFQYGAAANWFTNLDKLIHYVNKDGRVNVLYSNPEAYVAAKAREQVSWPLKTDDFFPYADAAHHFWTGYFTSRPDLKRFIRDSSAFFQVCKQLVACALPKKDFASLEPLAEAMALVQHHDAVSGTEKQHVAFDYALRLARARTLAEGTASQALAAITGWSGRFRFCAERNISRCPPTQNLVQHGAALDFVVWNGLAQERVELIELPLGTTGARIVDAQGVTLPSQVVASLPSVTDYGRPAGGASTTLLFRAALPAMGYSAFKLQAAPELKPSVPTSAAEGNVVISNEFLQITFCGNTRRMCKIVDLESGVAVKAEQDWLWYRGSGGDKVDKQPSGAYIFRPRNNVPERVSQRGRPTLNVIRGPLVEEVTSDFGGYVSQRVRLAKGERHAELTYTVHRLPLGDHWGKELVSRISTNIENKGECYTDSNGREMIYRRRDYRSSWTFEQTEPIAGNYYPVGTSIAIRDEKAQLTVLTDRAQGGSGTVLDGVVELMVHRRLLKDDHRGADEILNETQYVTAYSKTGEGGQHYGSALVVRGTHYITLASPQRAAAVWRPLQDRVYMAPAPFFLELTTQHTSGLAQALPTFSALSAPLPLGLQLVTVERVGPKSLLVRLAHQLGENEDAALSQPFRVDVGSMFKGRAIGIEELGLTGTVPRSEVLRRRINWRVEGEEPPATAIDSDGAKLRIATPGNVTLDPLQIKTFRVMFAGEVAKAGEVAMFI